LRRCARESRDRAGELTVPRESEAARTIAPCQQLSASPTATAAIAASCKRTDNHFLNGERPGVLLRDVGHLVPQDEGQTVVCLAEQIQLRADGNTM